MLIPQVELVNIGAADIVDGNHKLILGLIWSIILHWQVCVCVCTFTRCLCECCWLFIIQQSLYYLFPPVSAFLVLATCPKTVFAWIEGSFIYLDLDEYLLIQLQNQTKAHKIMLGNLPELNIVWLSILCSITPSTFYSGNKQAVREMIAFMLVRWPHRQISAQEASF